MATPKPTRRRRRTTSKTPRPKRLYRIRRALRPARLRGAFKAGLEQFGAPLLGIALCALFAFGVHTGWETLKSHPRFAVDRFELSANTRFSEKEFAKRCANFRGQMSLSFR